MSSARLAAIQMNSHDDVSANISKAANLLNQAADDGAVLAVLPENFAGMGSDESYRVSIAEQDGIGPIQDFLSAAASRHGMWIIGGTVPLQADDSQRPYAACLVIDDQGRRVARYDKIHLFDVSIPDGGKKSIAYQEASIMIPVVVEDLKVAGYFLPILFVDGPSAGKDQLQGSVPIVIGREMYGLPKIPATIEFDYKGQHINSGSVSFYGEKVITVTGKSAHEEEHTGRYTNDQRLDFAERIFG